MAFSLIIGEHVELQKGYIKALLTTTFKKEELAGGHWMGGDIVTIEMLSWVISCLHV